MEGLRGRDVFVGEISKGEVSEGLGVIEAESSLELHYSGAQVPVSGLAYHSQIDRRHLSSGVVVGRHSVVIIYTEGKPGYSMKAL
jgi:hypothetical protein